MEAATPISALWAWPFMSMLALSTIVFLSCRAIALDRDIPPFFIHSLIVTGLLVAAPGVPGTPGFMTSLLGAALLVVAAVPIRVIVNHDAQEEIIRIADIWLLAGFGIWFGFFDAIPGLACAWLLVRLVEAVRPPPPDAFVASRFLLPAAAVLFAVILVRGFWPAETILVPLAAFYAGIVSSLVPYAWAAPLFLAVTVGPLLLVPVFQELEAMRPSRGPLVGIVVLGMSLSLASFPGLPGWEASLMGMSVAALVAAALRGLLTRFLGETALEGGEVYLAAGAGALLGIQGLVHFFVIFAAMAPITWAMVGMLPALADRTHNGAWPLTPQYLLAVGLGAALLHYV